MSTAANVLGSWGRPPDGVAWAALALALLLGAGAATKGGEALTDWLRAPRPERAGVERNPLELSRRRFLALAAFVAAFLSLGYVAYYLRGGPRIIDATSYYLQGRALSHGLLDWPVVDPTASFRGRFLLFHAPDRLAGIFPPGYPLLLSLGFLIGAPLVIGPCLAAAVVLATYLLAREIAEDARLENSEAVARFAAAISVVCAALRYHTADTMAHAASALGVTLALAAALRGARLRRGRLFAAAGLAVGYVATTRPVSAIPIACVVAYLAVAPREVGDAQDRVRRAGLAALGLLPGLLFFAFANWRASGDPWLMPQRAYYAVSDGPPGCFRYGFGAGIGCVLEHGDFVKAHLENGYGLLQALGTTARRLRMHLTDVVNFEPLFLVLLYPLLRAARASRACRATLGVALLQIVAYAPFYFDGNYPGGGARFFAVVPPREHAAIAVAVAATAPTIPFARRALGVLAVSLAGFAVHGAFEHRALAERDGGRPMYEPDLARAANVDHGLLFFDTDHGFNLAYDPALSASHGILAVRLRNDDRDRLLYDKLGHPFSHAYRFSEEGPSQVVPWVPPPIVSDIFRFEAESDWPPLAQGDGTTRATWAAGTGASGDRVLEVLPRDPSAQAWAALDLPIPRADAYRVTPRVLLQGTGGEGTLTLYVTTDGKEEERARWTWQDEAGSPTKALDLPEQSFVLDPESGSRWSGRLILTAKNGSVALDKTTLKARR